MKNPRFILKQSANGQYYFILTANNGQYICSSEQYITKAACENGINSTRENAPIAVIEDTTHDSH